MPRARTRISTSIALAATVLWPGTRPAEQVPAEFVPVGVLHEFDPDPVRRQRDLEEMRRLGFNVVAPAGAAGPELELGVIDRLLGGASDAHVRRTGIGTVAVAPGASAAGITLRAWQRLSAGAGGVLFDDWRALLQNPDALVAATEFAEHITRNSALYAPLRPRVPPPGAADVALIGGEGTVTVDFLESADALLLIVTNSDPSLPRDVTMTFSSEMPEAVWQNMLTGAAVNFVAGPAGPVYTRTVSPEGVLVLMIRKRWRGPFPSAYFREAPASSVSFSTEMLPPLTIATIGPAPSTSPFSTAAMLAAPLGSATTFARVNAQTTAAAICPSSTVTTASMNRCASANVMSPGRTGIRPSAIEAVRGSVTGCPASSEAFMAAAPAGSTPIILTSGRDALTAAATPAARPPPPIGTAMVATEGSCSRISRPMVPCPAMIHS